MGHGPIPKQGNHLEEVIWWQKEQVKELEGINARLKGLADCIREAGKRVTVVLAIYIAAKIIWSLLP